MESSATWDAHDQMHANPINSSRRRSHGVLSPIVPDRGRHKHEKLAAQATWLANRPELAAEGRQHDRITGNGGDWVTPCRASPSSIQIQNATALGHHFLRARLAQEASTENAGWGFDGNMNGNGKELGSGELVKFECA